jgi:rod shape-determining protein MreD
MLNSFSDYLILNFKNIILHIFSLFFIILNLQNYNFFFEEEIRPFFIIMVLFFWAIYKPTLFNPFYIFFIGIMYDVFFNLVLGLHSFIFLFVYFVVSRQRIFLIGQNYFVVLSLFVVVISLVYAFQWLFFSIFSGSVHNYDSIFYNLIATILIFPIFNFINIFLRNSFTLSSEDKH